MRSKQIELINFSGGINNIVEPHLIELNYAHDLRNAQVKNGSIESLSGMAPVDAVDSEIIYQDEGKRSIVKWGGEYFWSDNETGDLGSSQGYLGIEAPTTQIAAATGEAGARFRAGSVYKYIYTFRTADGFRSGPYYFEDSRCEYENGTDIGSVLITGFDENYPEQVVAWEIWRTLADGEEYYKSGELSIWVDDKTYEDKTIDEFILYNEKIDLVNADTLPKDGKYLCEKNSVFYLASEERVYFSRQSNPHSWPALQFATFDDTINGMIATETYVMVFTRNRAYLLYGDTVADIAKQEIPDSQGVSNWRTIGKVRNMPVWVSNDGVCSYQAYDQRSGRKIHILSEGLIDIPSDAKAACVANDVYYLFYENETIAFDFRQGMKVYKLDWAVDWAWYDRDNDRLIGAVESTHFALGNGSKLEFTYVSPELTMGDMQNLKQLAKVHVDADCDLNFTFIIDGSEKWSFTSSKKYQDERQHFLAPGLNGRRIQFQVKGTGELRGLKFDYMIRRS